MEREEMKDLEIANIEEIAIAVSDMEKAIALFKELFGMKFEDGWDMPNEKMEVRSERIGEVQFQLLHSTSPEGVIAKFIQNRGEGVHHIAFRVRKLEETVARLKAKGVQFTPEVPVRKLAGDYIFIHPKSAHGVLIELIERPRN